jgi:hypothetical protein
MVRKTGVCLLRMITIYLVFAVFIISAIPSPSSAMFITPGAGNSVADSIGDMTKVQTFLESRLVQQRLADFGLTAEEVSIRLNQLSQDQLHQIATHIDEIDYGGDALGGILSVLVIIILIIVIIKIMGKQVIIK